MPAHSERGIPGRISRRWLLALLAFALGAGLFLRVYRFPSPGSPADPSAPLVTLPPGLDSDEAYHTLAAWRLGQTREVVPFFKLDQGMPAAFIYLTALVFQFTGPVAEGGRIVSLLIGIGMLAGLPLAALRLFPEVPAAATFTAAGTAFTFWFVDFSRIGLEQMTAAGLITLAVLAFWNWRERPGYLAAAGAGLSVALALYAYLAAFFVPVVLAAAGAYWLWLARPRWQPRWREALAAAAVCLAAAAPLAVFYWQNPDWALRRTSQTGNPSAAQVPVAFLRTLGALVWQGDDITRHNLDGRPLLDAGQALLLGIGLIYALRHWRRPAHGLVLLWFGGMLWPAALSVSPVHFGRLAGCVPAVMLLIGLGGGAAWRWCMALAGRPALRLAGRAALTAGVLGSAALTAQVYFALWPQVPNYLGTFDFPERVQAEAVLSLSGTDVFISPSDRGRSMFAFFWQDRALAQSYDGRQCLVVPDVAQRRTAWVVNVRPHEDTLTGGRLAALYPQLQTEILYVETGTPAVAQFSIPAGTVTPLPAAVLGRVGDFVELRGVQFLVSPARGTALPLRLTWRVTAAPADDWTVGLYLLDAPQTVYAQDDRRPCDHTFLTSVWQPGDVIFEDRALTLPADLPAGTYTLAATFYRLSDGERALVWDAQQQPAGYLLPLQTVTIP